MLFPEFPPSSHESHATVSLLAAAYMLWPENSEMRAGFCSLTGAEAANALVEMHRQDKDGRLASLSDDIKMLDQEIFPGHVRQFEDRLTQPFGGSRSIPAFVRQIDSSLSLELDHCGTAAVWAGTILGTVHQMDQFHKSELRGGASVGKAIDMLEDTGGPANSILWDHWMSHKSIAHLALASTVVYQRFSSGGRLHPYATDAFSTVLHHTAGVLHLARFFQEFGLKFVPKASSKGPILHPETTWRMPVSIPFTEDLYTSAPLTEGEQDSLRQRRAK